MALPIWPIWPNFEVNGLDWQCCVAGSSKTAPRILIFSIAMDADYSFSVKNIETLVPTFFKHNTSSVATVQWFAITSNTISELIFTRFCLDLRFKYIFYFKRNS